MLESVSEDREGVGGYIKGARCCVEGSGGNEWCTMCTEGRALFAEGDKMIGRFARGHGECMLLDEALFCKLYVL